MRKIILALAVALGLLVLVMHQHASRATMNRMPARKLVVSESERDISATRNTVPSSLKVTKTHTRKLVVESESRDTPAAHNSVPLSLKASKTHARKIVESDSRNTSAAHNSVSLSLKPSKQLGYGLPLGYGGYQGRGCDGVLSVQCWLKSFNLPTVIVEPLIQDSLCCYWET